MECNRFFIMMIIWNSPKEKKKKKRKGEWKEGEGGREKERKEGEITVRYALFDIFSLQNN